VKTLVVEDDFTSRLILQEMLGAYGPVHIAVNGREAVQAFRDATNAGEPYHLVCLDIMMPEMDGHDVLKDIRAFEETRGAIGPASAKVFMTSALSDSKNVFSAFKEQCEAYLVKPVDRQKLTAQLKVFGLVA
jgi:two-component system, chemotaxis family, chemotaxis protein CheY